MHRFSIIIPFLGNRQRFENTLASVLRYRTDNSEVVIVHDGSYEDPYDLGNEIKLVSMNRRPNLIRFFNAGVHYSSGEYLACIRPGVELTEDWNQPVEDAFIDPKVGSVCPAIVTANHPDKLIAAGVNHKFGFRRSVVGNNVRITKRTQEKLAPLGPTSWAAFYRADAIHSLDSIDEQLDQHFLDLEIALCLSTLGYESEFAPSSKVAIASSGLMTREMKRAHGKSSERAIRRHVLHLGTIANRGRSIQAFTLELLSAPLHPWTFKHALQRFNARPFNVRDEEFSDDISVLARRIRFGDANEAKTLTADDEYQHLSNANRRAA